MTASLTVIESISAIVSATTTGFSPLGLVVRPVGGVRQDDMLGGQRIVAARRPRLAVMDRAGGACCA